MLRPALLSVMLVMACSSSAPLASPDVPAVDGDGGDTSPAVAVSDAESSPDTAQAHVDTEADVTTGPFCGDGDCTDGESPKSCPSDCAPSPAAQCLEAACAKALSQCRAVPACETTYECLVGCATPGCSEACLESAAGDGKDLLMLALSCGQGAGCFGEFSACGDGVCGDGESPAECPADCTDGPTCGDGLCGTGEDPIACPEDCGSGPPCGDGTCDDGESTQTCPNDCPPVGCGDGACTIDESEADCPVDCAPKSCLGHCDQFDASWPCQCDAECAGYGDCCPDLAAACTAPVCGDGLCGSAETCPKDCEAPPVCGDSVCAPGEACEADCGPTSCEGICATYSEGAKCQCDAQCIGFGDCCGDYGPLCTPAPVCGDGACDFLETRMTCAVDCAVVPPSECIAKKCPVTVCQGSETCQPGLVCLAGCPDLTCAFGCILSVPIDFQGALSGAAGCADAKGCLAPESACGDGVCAALESAPDCPADCAEPLGLQCIKAQCAPLACTSDPACAAGLSCAAACTGQSCVDACIEAVMAPSSVLLTEVVACAVAAGCPNAKMTP